MRRHFYIIVFLGFVLASSPLALGFDIGTAMDKGKLEIDLTVNPFTSINYGQNYAFGHYGLGDKYELHGYLSKWGTITDWQNSTYEGYFGLLKQWAELSWLDLATSVGIRQVFDGKITSLIGPGILYTIKINERFRLGGHLLFIGAIEPNNFSIKPYNSGYTSELGGYYRLNQTVELALGAFTNSQLITRPTYSVNFYF